MPSTQPVRFDPSVETIAPDEAETLQGMKDSFREILETTSQDYGHAVRAVHAKAHGIARIDHDRRRPAADPGAGHLRDAWPA
ncbi:hypothetical protein [Sphingomonas sp. LR55]|uniref:hypothetical protein n=1 Tax=Sphingomonas sp. LR55 TaxID=3050231 RepID=UPI002FDF9295